ncbi:MAG: DUF2505 domain-containing protein [Deltaproteobacteria bacterium]|nr:DUF2505 domain-containing protein [Deltaproteobacteria bacterium]
MKVTVSHTLDCTAETFWKRIFFDREYNHALFVGEMKFPAYEVLELRETPERVDRKVRVTPPQKGPDIVRKFIKGTMSYDEIGAWTASDGAYRFRTITSTMTDKIKISGTVRVEPAAGGKIVRHADMEVVVDVMLVGGSIEKFLAGEIRSNYDVGAAFTNRWIAERKL